MLQTFKIKKVPVYDILASFISKYDSEVYEEIKENNLYLSSYKDIYKKILIGSQEALYITATYADLISHKLTMEEIKCAIYGGALMRIVDDTYDRRDVNDIKKFLKFTNPIIKSTIEETFPKKDDTIFLKKNYNSYSNPKNPLEKLYVHLDNLAYHLYCNLISSLQEKTHQKTNLAICLQRIQKTQELYLHEKEKSNLKLNILKQISVEKGGYTVLLPGYLIDSNLPSLLEEDLYYYFNCPLDKLINEKKVKNNNDFWRRQFLYLKGGIIQLLDDKHDKEEDRKMGITTIASKNQPTKKEEKKLHERLITVFEYAFKGDLSKIKYYWYLINIYGQYHKLLEK